MHLFPVPLFCRKCLRGVFLGAVLVMTACQQTPNERAMRIGMPSESALSLRTLETRRFDTVDETRMLSAAAQTLQDLGFTLTETSNEVGLLVGSKQRDAQEAGEVASQVALTVIGALLGVRHDPSWDKEQNISTTLTVSPVMRSKQVDVRVSFDRLVVRTNGEKRAELIADPEVYQAFFEKLSAAVFLEAHDL